LILIKLPDSLTSFRVIGLMSGTSVDGIDACGARLWVEEEQLRFDIEGTHTEPYPDALRKALLEAMSSQTASFETLTKLDLAVGHCFAQVAQNLMAKMNWTVQDVQAIGSHGQTLFHWPRPAQWGNDSQWLPDSVVSKEIGGTWQIGCPEVIAETTGVLTVADFRPRDMAAGGQGAPLVCLAVVLLFQKPETLFCIQNIGGIANVTVVPPQGSDIPAMAFDTGPGNMLMDLAAVTFFQESFDTSGNRAKTGQVHPDILAELLQNPYFQMVPPKTTGREKFGAPYWQVLQQKYPHLSGEDWLATLNAFTAESIVRAYEQFVFPEFFKNHTPASSTTNCVMVVGGGGAKNPVLLENIKQGFLKNQSGLQRTIEIQTHQDYGIPNQYKEALAFGILAWATCHKIPGNVPSCTGANRPVVLGKMLPSSN
jgi:anhydro-N-acetylmuramic acid kinase